MSNYRSRLGQLFIVGFPTETPDDTLLDFLEEFQIGGVILFGHNCQSHDMVKDIANAVRDRSTTVRPFVAIDQEGGRVCRLTGYPVEYRSAQEYGTKGDLEKFREEYRRAALVMESLGINLNLAPVCDIFLDENNSCLAGRCFGNSAERVAPFVRQAVKVSKEIGLLSCLKHFPGLGAATIDPHLATASADYDLEIFRSRERIPFAAGIKAGADMVMTTHLRLPQIDQQIVTASETILTTALRDGLAFDGPIITDDLCMKGAESLGNIGERAVTSFNAGHDLLLFGKDLDNAIEAFHYFQKAYDRGEVAADRVHSSVDRVLGLKFKLDSAMAR